MQYLRLDHGVFVMGEWLDWISFLHRGGVDSSVIQGIADDILPGHPAIERVVSLLDNHAPVDACLLIVEHTLIIYSIQMHDDPSGCGAKISWWPKGLSGGQEFAAEFVAEDLPTAILGALLTVLQAEGADG